jgi:hypothetical protein
VLRQQQQQQQPVWEDYHRTVSGAAGTLGVLCCLLRAVVWLPSFRTSRHGLAASNNLLTMWADHFCFHAGPSLAAELQRQLAQRQVAAAGVPTAAGLAAGAMQGPLLLPQRDLLGRRIAGSTGSAPSAAARQTTFAASSGSGDWQPGSATTAAEPAAVLPLSARGFMHHASL